MTTSSRTLSLVPELTCSAFWKSFSGRRVVKNWNPVVSLTFSILLMHLLNNTLFSFAEPSKSPNWQDLADIDSKISKLGFGKRAP